MSESDSISIKTEDLQSEDFVSDDEFEDEEFAMEDDEFMVDNVYDSSEVQGNKTDFEVIDAEKLINNQQQKVLSVAETLGITVGISGSLLRHFKWDQERLYGEFFDNKEKICKDAGVVLSKDPFFKGNAGEEMTCASCFDDYDGQQMLALPCKHYMCANCWSQFLTYAIQDGPSCLHQTCPYPNCTTIIDESLVKHVVKPDAYKKYSKFQARSFVDDNPRIRWCPAPDCGRAVYCPESVQDTVKCACGESFCFKCQEPAHAPCSCRHLRMWKQKERDESETANWLIANTKPCPKCSRQIEKNGGCNHMSCSQCSHEFCWICMEPWSYHDNSTGGFYKCNKYSPDEVDEKNKQSGRDEARRSIEKYMHYFKRYANHAQSQKFEKQLMEKAEAKMRDLQQINKYSSWVDVEYIQKGVQQLIECRTVLKYTYIHGYYLEEGQEKNMFEFLQEDLEKTTEKLSEILESPVEKFDRNDIINTTKSAKMRLDHLLQGCQENFGIRA